MKIDILPLHLVYAPDLAETFAATSARRCQYRTGKCQDLRVSKTNGKLHLLCHKHREIANANQRQYDKKRRVAVALQDDELRSHDKKKFASCPPIDPSLFYSKNLTLDLPFVFMTSISNRLSSQTSGSNSVTSVETSGSSGQTSLETSESSAGTSLESESSNEVSSEESSGQTFFESESNYETSSNSSDELLSSEPSSLSLSSHLLSTPTLPWNDKSMKLLPNPSILISDMHDKFSPSHFLQPEEVSNYEPFPFQYSTPRAPMACQPSEFISPTAKNTSGMSQTPFFMEFSKQNGMLSTTGFTDYIPKVHGELAPDCFEELEHQTENTTCSSFFN